MKIPRILHQTWKSEDMPDNFRLMAQTWKENHADWEYMLWTDEMNRDFVATHFPDFLQVYDSYPTAIQRVDAVRYFILFKYGGFFVDLDFECLACIEPIVNQAGCVFGLEPREHCDLHNKAFIISNAFMGTTAGSPFFQALCEELHRNTTMTDHPNDRVLETTGPFMLSRLYTAYIQKEEIALLDAGLMYPLTKEELIVLSQGIQQNGVEEKINNAYGIHHYAGTWWKK
ncbi:glycosyltransferase family 32 protein [Chitinophaga sp.]|uniref:glycosyltransferase family 32 protein n=1 Tax=Chitinophaga sp. TaxID=1869181 RepID=UPI002F944238